jgi:hypothetical protein
LSIYFFSLTFCSRIAQAKERAEEIDLTAACSSTVLQDWNDTLR